MNVGTTNGAATDPGLLSRLRNWDDTQSWEEFYRVYRRLIHDFARRQGRDHSTLPGAHRLRAAATGHGPAPEQADARTDPTPSTGLGDTGGTAVGAGTGAGPGGAPEQKNELRNHRATAKYGARGRSFVRGGGAWLGRTTPRKCPHLNLHPAATRELPQATHVPNTTGWKPVMAGQRACSFFTDRLNPASTPNHESA